MDSLYYFIYFVFDVNLQNSLATLVRDILGNKLVAPFDRTAPSMPTLASLRNFIVLLARRVVLDAVQLDASAVVDDGDGEDDLLASADDAGVATGGVGGTDDDDDDGDDDVDNVPNNEDETDTNITNNTITNNNAEQSRPTANQGRESFAHTIGNAIQTISVK